jgi:hypothetical protein
MKLQLFFAGLKVSKAIQMGHPIIDTLRFHIPLVFSPYLPFDHTGLHLSVCRIQLGMRAGILLRPPSPKPVRF